MSPTCTQRVQYTYITSHRDANSITKGTTQREAQRGDHAHGVAHCHALARTAYARNTKL